MERGFPAKDNLIRAGKTLLQMFNPIKMIVKASIDMKDSWNFKKTKEEYWCSNCNLFVIQCPHCNKVGIAQSSIPNDEKKQCINCFKEFYYSVSGD